MRTSAVAFASLLLLLLLATSAHGIRLDRQLHEALSSKQETGDPKSGAAAEASIAASATTKHCAPDNGHCSGKVKRALAHSETAGAKQQKSSSWPTGNDHHSTAEDAEAAQHGRHEAEATSSHAVHASLDASSAAASPGAARQRERQTYPDIMDIAGMDYSPATRKPPIHN